MSLELVLAPDTILEQIAKPVEKINDKLIRTLHKMLDLMYDSNGCGLAAPQVGISRRFFVMHTDTDNDDPYFFINPVIIKVSKELYGLNQGCLSVPEQSVTIYRPKIITVEYLNEEGKKQIKEFTDFDAACIQHEIDHLNGIIITDYIEDKTEKKIAQDKSKKIKDLKAKKL